jgi:hypothetical protein
VLLLLVAKGEGNNIYGPSKMKLIGDKVDKKVSSSLVGAALRRLADNEFIYSKERGVWDISDPALREFLLSLKTYDLEDN